MTPDTSKTTSVATAVLSDQDISDAYIYLIGRLLVTRQQQLDFHEGFTWNQLLHRSPGAVDWPNPNLDVAYSEGWIAVDEHSCTLVTVPKMSGRYYTVQLLNGWGETLANINERVFPDHPYGQFAVCLKGANVNVPEGARRVDLPVKHARVLTRVELGSDWDRATALQQQFTLTAVGTPELPTVPKTPLFDLEALPGVEAFDAAPVALDSDADINPGMERLQANVRAIARAVEDPAVHGHVDDIIHERVLADFAKAGPLIGHGSIRHGWVRPSTAGVYGSDYLTRSLVNFGGIWANVFDEVVYYKGAVDSSDVALRSDQVYTMTFEKDQLPAMFARYFWSVVAVDGRHMRVLPNRMNRFLINNHSRLEYDDDGSLTLYFAAYRPLHVPDANWLPTSGAQPYRLTFRFYGPQGGVADGTYYPPPLVRQT
jgi:hypothetical protein